MRLRLNAVAVCIAIVAAAAATTRPAAAASDLVPIVANLLSGEAAVINAGRSAAGPSHMTVGCANIVGAGGCAESAGMAAYEDAGYPNVAVIAVPALQPGEVFEHQLAFWDELVWAPGTYQLTLTVDAGGEVAEGNEANNQSSVQKVQRRLTGSIPIPPGPQDVTAQPGGGGKPKPGLQPQPGLVAALPNIMATPIGFVVGSGPVRWGATATIDSPAQLKATRSGAGRAFCILAPAGYRTYNNGPMATGNFQNTVYREGTVVRTQALALAAKSGTGFEPFDLPLHEGMNIIRVVLDSAKQVSESDERNTFAIKIDVAVDCNGDGRIRR